MDFLKLIYEERKKYFENLDEYLKEIKNIVKKEVSEFEIYKLDVFGLLTKIFIDSPFEFHLLTKKQWNFYKRFIKTAKALI